MHTISNTPDPIIGQWIGGEPPSSDLHLIFYENQTFISTIFFKPWGNSCIPGTGQRYIPDSIQRNQSPVKQQNGCTDSFYDSLYMSKIPQMTYSRYKG